MSYYIIQGNKKLKGEITVNSSKNAAVALLCASLINEGITVFKNFPELEETKRIIEVLESIGVKISLQGRTLTLKAPKKFNLNKINIESARKTRSILLFIGSLSGRLNKFKLPMPSGCKLGSRTVMPHIYALEKLGIEISSQKDNYFISKKKSDKLREIVLYESGDTVTENTIMTAACQPGKTTIKFASSNYQVQELCFFLQLFGVKIENIGSTTITVTGLKSFNKNVIYTLAEDPIEAMMFISLAATTGSNLIIRRCPIDFLELELLKLEKMNLDFKVLKKYKSYNKKTNLVDLEIKPSRLIALNEKIYGRPYPGLNIDNLPFFVPVATQAKGKTLIHDWVYENRAIYYTELSRLGANITLADPHRVYIEGPTKLIGHEIVCPPALRPSVIILIAMLAAKGQSILRNTYSIDRGYENLHERLAKLGAKIEKIEN